MRLPADWGRSEIAHERLSPHFDDLQMQLHTAELRFESAQDCWHALTRPLLLSGNQRGELRPRFDSLLVAWDERRRGRGAPRALPRGARPPARSDPAGRYPVRPLMPKMKSHSGAKKRFKKTATGKLKARHAFSSHILEKKSPKYKRNLGVDVAIAKADQKTVTKLLGGNGR